MGEALCLEHAQFSVPPEHDLQSGLEADLGVIVTAYRDAGGERHLYLDHFAFYLLRRYLVDMTIRFLVMLDGPLSREQTEDELSGIRAWGFDKWRGLDEQLEIIQAVIG